MTAQLLADHYTDVFEEYLPPHFKSVWESHGSGFAQFNQVSASSLDKTWKDAVTLFSQYLLYPFWNSDLTPSLGDDIIPTIFNFSQTKTDAQATAVLQMFVPTELRLTSTDSDLETWSQRMQPLIQSVKAHWDFLSSSHLPGSNETTQRVFIDIMIFGAMRAVHPLKPRWAVEYPLSLKIKKGSIGGRIDYYLESTSESYTNILLIEAKSALSTKSDRRAGRAQLFLQMLAVLQKIQKRGRFPENSQAGAVIWGCLTDGQIFQFFSLFWDKTIANLSGTLNCSDSLEKILYFFHLFLTNGQIFHDSFHQSFFDWVECAVSKECMIKSDDDSDDEIV